MDRYRRRRDWTAAALLLAGLTVCAPACDDRAIGVGYEGEACGPLNQCEDGMVCLGGVCVRIPERECEPGGSRPCPCPDGPTGLEVCGANGTWQPCLCPPEDCGNGVLDPGEECDGDNLNGVTCFELGYFDGGEPSCVACRIDPTTCCHDADRDGYGEGCPLGPDCDDTDPLLNPGMPEIPGDGIDNDCDGWVDETGQLDDCVAAPPGETVLELMTRSIGVPLSAITNLQITGNAAAYGSYSAWGAIVPRVHTTPGDGFLPVNCRFVILATGATMNPDPQAGDLMDMGIYEAPDPAPVGLQDGASVNDLVQFSMSMTVPPSVTGFSFDFLFLSVEYPEYVCSEYNDTFYALVTGEPQLGHVLTNITYDDVVPEMCVNSVLFQTPPHLSVNITGTGYETSDLAAQCTPDPLPGCTPPDPCPLYVGSTTGWLRTTTPATPGATVDLTFSIHDEGDNILDSAVVIDNFHWRYDPSITQPVTVPAP